MLIKHLQHKDIDFERWDNCISNAKNGLIYAFSWYLDVVSPEWEALVEENYEYVMPLPVKKKYYIPYIVQPFLTQQLGVFSELQITEEIIKLFIRKIPYYSYHLQLNEKNEYSEIKLLPNYILNLKKSYREIAGNYSKNTQRNIDKAKKLHLSVSIENDIQVFLEFYTRISKHLQPVHFEIIKKVILKTEEKNVVHIYTIRDESNEIISALALLTTHKRLTYFLPVSDATGKKNSAMFLLVDELIQHFSQKDLILDFEGSGVEGIARFYKGFGAVNQPYYSVKKNRPDFLVGKFTGK